MIELIFAAMIFIQTPTVNGEPVNVYWTGMAQEGPTVPMVLYDHWIDTSELEGEWTLIIQTGKEDDCPVYNHPLEKAIEGLREAAGFGNAERGRRNAE